jgi:two-component system, OmpR family, sensor histidine kinase VicK
MTSHTRKFNNDDLIAILALSKDATAIYTTEDLVIEMANDAMISFWGKDRSVIGQAFPEAVPELIGQPFFDLLKEVWQTGNTYEAKDTAAQLRVDGKLQWFYYDFIYRAIKNENGEVYCILHTATDVSELHRNRLLMLEGKEREHNLAEELTATNEELAAANEELLQSQESLSNINNDLEDRVAARLAELSESEQQKQQLINMLPASVVVIRGQELIVELINQSNLDYWNKTADEVIGKPFLEILPDLAAQPFAGQLRQVMETGEKIDVKESPVLFTNPDGSTRETFVDYTYQPLTDINGNRTGVLVMSFEITDRVISRKLLEKYTDDLQNINGKLSIANSELASSEARFKYLIQEAPVAIGVLSGRELIIDSANDLILRIWGKTTNIIGLPLASGLPELEGQPFLRMLDDVYISGKAFYGNEVRAMLGEINELREYYLNFVYQPIKNEFGSTSGILVVASDVTEQVKARKKIERAEESLRMAIDAAELGSYSIKLNDREFIASPKLKEFFGYFPEEKMPYEAAINQIHPDHRERITGLVEYAIAKNERYDVEYPVIGYHDNKTRWVRAIGTVQHDVNSTDSYFTGMLHEITEKKLDEIRKNDFIGMVSHELKTPLTSLNAYLQMLHSKAKKAEDTFSVTALDQSVKQVKRMTTMINGFLNVSRLESAKIDIDKKRFDMAGLVKESEVETFAMYSSHKINFAPVQETLVYADRDKIGQVITNLISNAVKYSKPSSTINIACITVNGFARISVVDEGIGIKKEVINRIFERYYRVENNNLISGFGIGLYLSAEIIERHQGKIWVESEPRKGSTFYFSLPVVT